MTIRAPTISSLCKLFIPLYLVPFRACHASQAMWSRLLLVYYQWPSSYPPKVTPTTRICCVHINSVGCNASNTNSLLNGFDHAPLGNPWFCKGLMDNGFSSLLSYYASAMEVVSQILGQHHGCHDAVETMTLWGVYHSLYATINLSHPCSMAFAGSPNNISSNSFQFPFIFQSVSPSVWTKYSSFLQSLDETMLEI